MSAADVEVMVDGKPCEVIPEQYEPAKRLVGGSGDDDDDDNNNNNTNYNNYYY